MIRIVVRVQYVASPYSQGEMARIRVYLNLSDGYNHFVLADDASRKVVQVRQPLERRGSEHGFLTSAIFYKTYHQVNIYLTREKS